MRTGLNAGRRVSEPGRPAVAKDRLLWTLVAITALCYAIGYPLALGADNNIGWVFVTLGGPFLIAVLVLLVRRAQR